MMTKTWLKEAGINNVGAFFSLEEVTTLESWSSDFRNVSAKSYMRGYRDICKDVSFLHKLMIHFCDRLVKMIIVKTEFKR